jgi:hypothetical protein
LITTTHTLLTATAHSSQLVTANSQRKNPVRVKISKRAGAVPEIVLDLTHPKDAKLCL